MHELVTTILAITLSLAATIAGVTYGAKIYANSQAQVIRLQDTYKSNFDQASGLFGEPKPDANP